MDPPADELKQQLHHFAFSDLNKIYLGSLQKDRTLGSASLAILIGFFVFPSVAKFSEPNLKWLFLLSFISIFCGELLVLWRLNRLPKRLELMENRSKDTAKEASKLLDSFTEAYIIPLARYQGSQHVKDLIKKGKSKEEIQQDIDAFIETQNKRTESFETGEYVTEENKKIRTIQQKANENLASLIALAVATGTQLDYKKSFKLPLDEKNAKLKFWIDKFSENYRLLILYFGYALTVVSLILDLISK
jgi:hypothetical protein